MKTFVMILLILGATTFTIGAQAIDPEGLTWEVFLRWLITPGGIVVVVSWIKSAAVEQFAGAWYHSLETKWKQVIFLAISMVVPVVGVFLGVFTLGWSLTWDPLVWNALVAGCVAFSTGTLFHTVGLATKRS